MNKQVTIYRDTEHLVDILRPFKGASMGTIEMVTTPRNTVKSRVTAEPFEVVFPNEVRKRQRLYVSFGNSYYDAVGNRREKADMEREIEREAPRGKTRYSRIMLQALKNPDVKYIEVFPNLNANWAYSEVTWEDKDGNPLSDELVNRFEVEFGDKKYESKKQGLGDKQVLIITPKASNIYRLKLAGNIYVRQDESSSEELREALKRLWSEGKGNPPLTLKEIYRRMATDLPNKQSRIRFILTDRTDFERVNEGTYRLSKIA